MENINYQKQLDKLIGELQLKNQKPTLLLQSCCGPCSSYVLEYLEQYFKITVYYFNPNIYPDEEYQKRLSEQKRLIGLMNACGKDITFQEGEYDYKTFEDLTNEHQNDPEGGERCSICYELRLRQTALKAKQENFDYFTTTLSVSPYKNAKKINEIGIILQQEYGVKFLFSDFKKKNGYKRSIELSNQYELYRQNYCGCKSSLEFEVNKQNL